MITFSNGHKLTFACASGALAFDGRGWWWEAPLRWIGILNPKAFTIVAKTVTLKSKKGNLSMWHPWSCVRLIRKSGMKGATNAIGLTNPGIEKWISKHYPIAIREGYRIAASVKPNDPDEAAAMAKMLAPLTLAYVEVNVSCPNVCEIPSDVPLILKQLQASGHPIVLKLSVDQVRAEFVNAVERWVEAYHVINTIPWNEIFDEKKYPSPIAHYAHGQSGGVSGDFIRTTALQCVQKMKGFTQKPVIGGGGIFTVQHVRDFEGHGASAFSIGTCFLLRPWMPNKIVREYGKSRI